jgi:hypothetical protein
VHSSLSAGIKYVSPYNKTRQMLMKQYAALRRAAVSKYKSAKNDINVCCRFNETECTRYFGTAI